MVIRCARLIAQPFDTLLLITVNPLVGRFPADFEAAAQFCHAPFLPFEFLYEFESFFHGTCFFPAHKLSGRVLGLIVLPMCPVCSVTYVPGLYRLPGPDSSGHFFVGPASPPVHPSEARIDLLNLLFLIILYALSHGPPVTHWKDKVVHRIREEFAQSAVLTNEGIDPMKTLQLIAIAVSAAGLLAAQGREGGFGRPN